MMQAKQQLRGTNFTIQQDFPAEIWMKRSRVCQLSDTRWKKSPVRWGYLFLRPPNYPLSTVADLHGMTGDWSPGWRNSASCWTTTSGACIQYDLLQSQQHTLHQQQPQHPASKQQFQLPAVEIEAAQLANVAGEKLYYPAARLRKMAALT